MMEPNETAPFRREHRRVIVNIEGLIDPTQYNWLQYHQAYVMAQRNRLALLPKPQLLTYANLHFNQITTFEQVAIYPPTRRQTDTLINKVSALARNALSKSANTVDPDYTMTSTTNDNTQISTSNAIKTTIEEDHTLPADEPKRVEECSIVTEDKSSSSQKVPSDPQQDADSKGLNPCDASDATPAPPSDQSLDNSLPLRASLSAVPAVELDSAGEKELVLDEGSDVDDDDEDDVAADLQPMDNDVDGQNDPPLSPRTSPQASPRLASSLVSADPAASSPRPFPPTESNDTTRVHVLDASLNRIRRLQLPEITQWNVRSIMFMNLSGNLLVSLEGIECCKNLIALDCSDNILTLMHPIRGCSKLNRLRINGNRLISISLMTADETEEDVGDASLWPQLEYMDMNDNKLGARGLEGLRMYGKNLIHLEMRNCNVTTKSIPELEDSAKLDSLHADNNQLDSLPDLIAVLSKMPCLKHLSLLGNPIASGVTLSEDDSKSDGRMGVDDSKAGEPKGDDPATRSTIGMDILQSFGLGDYDSDSAPEAAQTKLSTAGQQKQQPTNSKYAITIFDHVSTLVTFDHLAVPPGLYLDLAKLKAQVVGEEMLVEISTKYSREITAAIRVKENLMHKHRMDEELLEQAIQTKTSRLEAEMEEIMQFGREQLDRLRRRAASKDHYKEVNPKEILSSIVKKRDTPNN